MKFLDSTFLIDFLREDPDAVEIASKISSESLATSSINIFEVMLGINLDKRKTDAKLKKFNGLISNFDILSFDKEDSFAASEIASSLMKKGQAINDLDFLIAGIMKSHNIIEIITRDKHFSKIKEIKVITY